MDWDDLRIFLGVARANSLTGAARGLKLDPGTLSRRIARLEGAAGATLFLKSPQGYALTGAGQELVTYASAMERSLSEAQAAVRGVSDELRGPLRIGAPDGVANFVLPQVAATLSQAYPDLEIQIVALPRVFDLSRREADIAITVTPPQSGRLRVQKLCAYHLSLAASADYLDSAPPCDTRHDLPAHRFIGYIPDMLFAPELDFLAQLGLPTHLSSNSASVQLGLLRAGAGLGVVHDFARPFAPGLARVLPGEVRFERAFYLVRPSDDARSERGQRLGQLLGGAIRSEVTRLESQA